MRYHHTPKMGLHRRHMHCAVSKWAKPLVWWEFNPFFFSLDILDRQSHLSTKETSFWVGILSCSSKGTRVLVFGSFPNPNQTLKKQFVRHKCWPWCWYHEHRKNSPVFPYIPILSLLCYLHLKLTYYFCSMLFLIPCISVVDRLEPSRKNSASHLLSRPWPMTMFFFSAYPYNTPWPSLYNPEKPYPRCC